jgi:hypothetical protein
LQINDYDAFVLDLTRCLRPNGILILMDGEVAIRGEDKLPFPPAPINGTYPETKGWFARILYGVPSSPSSRLESIQTATHVRYVIHPAEASRGMTARRARVLANVTAALTRAMLATRALEPPVVYTMHVPLGPWPTAATDAETQWIRRIGEMMRTNAREFVHTLRPMLLAQGFEDAMIDVFLDGAQRGGVFYLKKLSYTLL